MLDAAYIFLWRLSGSWACQEQDKLDGLSLVKRVGVKVGWRLDLTEPNRFTRNHRAQGD